MSIFDNYLPGKIRPTHGYFGAKAFLARKIVQQLPDHRIYVECFAGALNVLLNKYRAEVEVVSDLNADLINFYQVLVNRTDELIGQIQKVPYTREVFEAAQQAKKTNKADELTRALNYITIQRMIWSGVGHNWMNDPKRKETWSHMDERLPPVAERLRGVTLLCRNALEVLLEYDSPHTASYIDPPYYPGTRVSPKAYAIELSAFDHLKLLQILKKLKGHVVLSGYNNIYYQKELGNWQKIEIDIAAFSGPTSAGKSKTRRTEVLWIKPGWRF